MQEHGLVTFALCGCFDVSRASAFYLDSASSFLLDVFDVGTTMPNHLGAKVEAWNRF